MINILNNKMNKLLHQHSISVYTVIINHGFEGILQKAFLVILMEVLEVSKICAPSLF